MNVIKPVDVGAAQVKYLVGSPVSSKDVQTRLTDVLSNIALVKAVTDLLPNAGALTSLAQDSTVAKDATVAKDSTVAKASALTTAQNAITAIKAVTDVLPNAGALTSLAQDSTVAKASALSTLTSNVSTAQSDLTAMKGSGFASSDSLKDIKAAVMAVQNNTSFTASVIPQMIIPASGNTDAHNLVNVYDGAGNMLDPDLALVLMKYEVSHGASRNSNLFDNAARSTAATKVAIYTITAPTPAPTAGAIYHDSASTSMTVIGMIGTTTLVASWTGATAPVVGTGTLTKDSGTGQTPITASAVDTSFVAMVNDPGIGQYSEFYNTPSTHLEENLSARFMYYIAGVQRVFDRSTETVSPQNAATQAAAVWDVTSASHVTAGTTGKVAVDTKADTAAIKAVTDLLPNGGALTSLAQDSTVAKDATVAKAATVALDATVAKAAALTTAQGNITTILGIANALPNGGALTSLAQDSTVAKAATVALDSTVAKAAALTTAQNAITAIKAVTDLLPNAGALSSLAQDSTVAKAAALTAVSTLVTDALPKPVLATKTSSALAQGANATLTLSTTEGFNAKNVNIKRLTVVATGATTSFKVEIFEKTGGVSKIIDIQEANATDGVDLAMDDVFVNADTSPTNALYAKITNVADAGTSTFAFSVRGVKLSDTVA